MSKYSQYLVYCECGRSTSKVYARAHDGMCKACVTGGRTDDSRAIERAERNMEMGSAYTRENNLDGSSDCPY